LKFLRKMGSTYTWVSHCFSCASSRALVTGNSSTSYFPVSAPQASLLAWQVLCLNRP
jgi:hypothetical protein